MVVMSGSIRSNKTESNRYSYEKSAAGALTEPPSFSNFLAGFTALEGRAPR
jgi:hypothetical protein